MAGVAGTALKARNFLAFMINSQNFCVLASFIGLFLAPLKPVLSGHDFLLKILGNFLTSIRLRGSRGR